MLTGSTNTEFIHLWGILLPANLSQIALKKLFSFLLTIQDVDAGVRTEDVIQRSIERIPLYEKLNTCKVDVSEITPEQVADYIIHHC